MSIEFLHLSFKFIKCSKKIIHFPFVFAFLFSFQFTSNSENLVKNPGFEEQIKRKPVYWSLFIKPQKGSFGKIDNTTSHTGENSALLNNALNYHDENMNN